MSVQEYLESLDPELAAARRAADYTSDSRAGANDTTDDARRAPLCH
jgi:hypothetical protein